MSQDVPFIVAAYQLNGVDEGPNTPDKAMKEIGLSPPEESNTPGEMLDLPTTLLYEGPNNPDKVAQEIGLSPPEESNTPGETLDLPPTLSYDDQILDEEILADHPDASSRAELIKALEEKF